jgi:Zn-dependent M28 family amino/carboxypeptidase
MEAKKPGALSPEEERLAKTIRAADISARTRFLSHDLLEGRGPGSRGGDLAVQYIASELESFGLVPGATDGSFLQRVPLVGITASAPPKVTFKAAATSVTLATGTDLVLMSGVQKPSVKLPNAELVFVGYGIIAPEYQWDDYKDVDVTGKIVVVMNNDPENDPKLFAGKTRLWYGRYDYKYLQAAKKGAAGTIIIHTEPSAGYPWSVVQTSNAREKFELPDEGNEPRSLARMWATEPSVRKLFAAGGADYDALIRSAEARDFRPKQLGVRTEITWTNKLRNVESANVLGLLRGRDEKLRDEAVVFTAHHDHLGIGEPKKGDAIYNGAVDNASGVATLLAMARAYASGTPPRRSLLFLAVAAEEQGLLGSEYYARHPTFAAGRIAANINMDSVNVLGRTSDLGFIGYGRSSLDAVVDSVAAAQGRTVHGDAFPERGAFYRSDQFNFAKIGVPALYVAGGPNYVGRPPGWGEQQRDLYVGQHYHQPSDEFDPSWNLEGAVEDAQLMALVGLRVANADGLPKWNENDEFARVQRAR